MWLSLVERHVRDVEAVGSSPVTSTSVTLDPKSLWIQRRFLFAQLCVAQLCSAHRTKALQWVKVPMRDAGPNFALGSALFISSAQLCVAQLCSVHRTKALQWVKVPMRDAGPKFALGSASLFVCTVVRCATVQCAQDEWFSMAQNFILSVSGALNFRVLMLSDAYAWHTAGSTLCRAHVCAI